nr:MAG TPA: Transcriptional regulator [Caudoviricetes sp.]
MKCPVRVECQDYRKRTGSTDGIWGGKTTKRGEV